LQAFAVSSSKEDGEFYTPTSIVNLIAELIEPFSGIVYDPCCGSGGMFVSSLRFVESHNGNRNNVSIVGQEKQDETWRLAKMNLAIRGIAHNLGKKNESTFAEDLHPDKKVDFIMANPPFNLNLKKQGEVIKATDPRWAGYGTPPDSNANYGWILHMISKLDVQNGVAGFLLSNGALKPDGEERKICENIVKNDKIEAIIVLPRDMFYQTDISVTLWILNNNKGAGIKNGKTLRNRKGEVLFVDLRRWDNNVAEYKIDESKKKKKVVLDEGQIKQIKELLTSWQTGEGYKDIPELCKSATLEDIKKQKYILAPSKYIEFIDHDLEIDFAQEMARIRNEMKEVLKTEKDSQDLLETAFRGIGYDI
jgi:type I restriction enzyme M protein